MNHFLTWLNRNCLLQRLVQPKRCTSITTHPVDQKVSPPSPFRRKETPTEHTNNIIIGSSTEVSIQPPVSLLSLSPSFLLPPFARESFLAPCLCLTSWETPSVRHEGPVLSRPRVHGLKDTLCVAHGTKGRAKLLSPPLLLGALLVVSACPWVAHYR